MIHGGVISFIINWDYSLSFGSTYLWNYVWNSKSSLCLSSYHVREMLSQSNLIQGLKVVSFPKQLSWLTKLRNFHRDFLSDHFVYLRIMIQGHGGLFTKTFAHRIDKAHINLHKYLRHLDFQSEYFDFFKSYVIYFNHYL